MSHQTVSARKYYATFWRRGFSTVTRLRVHPRSSTFLPSCWIHSYLHSLGLIHAKSFPPRDGRWEGERARASYTLGLAAICACSPWPWGHVAPSGRNSPLPPPRAPPCRRRPPSPRTAAVRVSLLRDYTYLNVKLTTETGDSERGYLAREATVGKFSPPPTSH